jgi:hypothetical protein
MIRFLAWGAFVIFFRLTSLIYMFHILIQDFQQLIWLHFTLEGIYARF